MNQNIESAISALRATGLHRCSSDLCNQGRKDCPTKQACIQPEPECDMTATAKAIVYAATLAVALLGVATAIFS